MTFDLPVCSLVVKAGGINAENDIDRSTIILALIGFRQNHYPVFLGREGRMVILALHLCLPCHRKQRPIPTPKDFGEVLLTGESGDNIKLTWCG